MQSRLFKTALVDIPEERFSNFNPPLSVLFFIADCCAAMSSKSDLGATAIKATTSTPRWGSRWLSQL
jgi:hypothetical protein